MQQPTADRLVSHLRDNPVLWECLERLSGLGLPYTSSEDAIGTWPTTATAVGVRLAQGRPVVFAPYGLDDLLGLVVRANRVQITPEIYRRKVSRWTRHWPNLTVLPWAAGRGKEGDRNGRARGTSPAP